MVVCSLFIILFAFLGSFFSRLVLEPIAALCQYCQFQFSGGGRRSINKPDPHMQKIILVAYHCEPLWREGFATRNPNQPVDSPRWVRCLRFRVSYLWYEFLASLNITRCCTMVV